MNNAKPNYWILIAKDGEFHGEERTAFEIISHRIGDLFFGVIEDANNLGRVGPGDKVIFYAAGKCQFIGNATVDHVHADPSGNLPDYLQSRAKALAAGTGIYFRSATLWDSFIETRQVVEHLAFVPNKEKWYASFQGTIRRIEPQDFEFLMDREDEEEAREFVRNSFPYLEKTETERLAKLRVGQARFRRDVLEYWNERCAVLEAPGANLLIASHIKPGAECSTADEKLSPYNGLALSPTLNHLFDRGLISFDSTNGQIIASPRLLPNQRASLSINDSLHLSRIEPEHKPFLDYHFEYVFQKGIALSSTPSLRHPA
jgi:hypothetical protein